MKNIQFINAGAGSGKTFRLIEELYKKISDGACAADEIIVTTFTKKAASEIKVKAREKLLKKGLSNEANKLQNALMGTVHSVGSQIIEKFWHYSGLPKDIQVMSEEDTATFFSQAITNIPTKEELEEITSINHRLDLSSFNGEFSAYNENRWREDLLKIIGHARTNRIVDFTDSILRSKNLYNGYFVPVNLHIDFDLLQEVLPDLIACMEDLQHDDKRKKYITKIVPLHGMDDKRIKYYEMQLVHDSILELKEDYDELGDQADKLVGHLGKILYTQDLKKDVETYIDLLFTIAEKSIGEYQKFKQEQGLIDYSDMEVEMLDLLDIAEVKEEIRQSIKLVLVDEFQDSNPIQLAIFIKLSDLVNQSIWVGDPKQAIFGFRGTDPQLIEAIIDKFKAALPEENLTMDNLPNSWRSRPDIVMLNNEIFTHSLAGQVDPRTIPLNPVRTNQGFTSDPENHALQHWHFEDSTERGGKIEYHKAYLVDQVKKLIESNLTVIDKGRSTPSENPEEEIVQTRKLKPSDVAILCKTNKNVKDIAENFKSAGIEVSAETDGLTESAEFKFLNAVFRLISNPENSLATAEILLLTDHTTSTSGIIDSRLQYLKGRGSVAKPKFEDYEGREEQYRIDYDAYLAYLSQYGAYSPLIVKIKNMAVLTGDYSVSDLVERAVNELNVHSICNAWGNARQRRANVQKILERASQYEAQCITLNKSVSLTGFINYLDSLGSLEQNPSKSDKAINILTYHKSKGLEWPVVVIYDTSKDPKREFIVKEIFTDAVESVNPVIDLEDILRDRVIRILPWPLGAKRSLPDDIKDRIEASKTHVRAEIRLINEHKRLMYVGMTRPRDFLITTTYRAKKQHWMNTVYDRGNWKMEKQAFTGGFADLFTTGINVHVNKFIYTALPVYEPEEEKDVVYFKKDGMEREYEPYYLLPSKLAHPEDVSVHIHAQLHDRIGISGSTDAADIFGTCLHNVLYKLNPNAAGNLEYAQRIITNYRFEDNLNTQEVCDKLLAFQKHILAEFNPINQYKELYLEQKLDGQLMKGEADLVLELDKELILIDYKSYPGTVSNVTDPGSSFYAGKYAGQLNAYKQMLEAAIGKPVSKKLIYYVVLGVLVEVE